MRAISLVGWSGHAPIGVAATTMPTPHNNASCTPFRIEEHSQPIVRWYVVDDMNANGLCTFEIDAYVIAWDDRDGLPPVISFIVLFTDFEAPPFVYAPSAFPEPVELAIRRALAAFRGAYPGHIPALEGAPELEPEALEP